MELTTSIIIHKKTTIVNISIKEPEGGIITLITVIIQTIRLNLLKLRGIRAIIYQSYSGGM
jgi:hypothetical protein